MKKATYYFEYDWLYLGNISIKVFICSEEKENIVDSLCYPYGKRWELKTKKQAKRVLTKWAKNRCYKINN